MHDVIVIGGRPAGTLAATFLPRQRLSVTLLGRERFPRLETGDSLVPYSGLFSKITARGRRFANTTTSELALLN